MDHGHADSYQEPPWSESNDAAHLAARNAEGAGLFATGRYKDAVSVLANALAGCLAEFGPEHPSTLTVAGNLGVAQVAAGQRREGIATITANLADRVRVFGDEEPRTLVAREALATAYRLTGEVDDAVALSKQVTGQRLRLLGPADPSTLVSRMGLIRAVAAAGDVSSAVGMLTSAVRDAEAAHGSEHGLTRALLECGRNSGLISRGA